MIHVKQYDENDHQMWNNFIENSKNHHFMFLREYIEYHKDRFIDSSLIFENDGKIVGLMPANIEKGDLYSHNGLTFGGVISNNKMSMKLMLEVFSSLRAWGKHRGVSRLFYKAIPYIYSSTPAQEDLYALFVNNSQLYRRDISTSIKISDRISYSKGKKWNLKKAKNENLQIERNMNFVDFWKLLNKILKIRHGISPVHNVDEITNLANKFPNNISLYEVRDKNNTILAGSVLYITKNVVHTQYLATSDFGRNIGALDYLIDQLIDKFSDHKYFDFGISSSENGKILNNGLCAQKEGFGGRGIVHDFYVMNLA